MKSILGIDLGGTETKMGVVKEDGSLLRTGSVHTLVQQGPTQWTRRVFEEIDSWNIPIDVIALGSPGPLDTLTGTIQQTPNLEKFAGHSIKKDLEKHFGKPCYVENDGNCAALAEHFFGSNKHLQDIVVLTLGTGVGSGVISNGRLVRGARGFAVELGHMSITANSGALCHCGRQGCLESYVGGRNLVERYEKQTGKSITVRDLFQMDQDPYAQKLIEEWIWALSIAIDNIVLLFDPQKIVVSGGLTASWPQVESRLHSKLDSLKSKETLKSMKVEKSALGSFFGILGAAALVLEQTSVMNGR